MNFSLPKIQIPNIAHLLPPELVAWASITLLVLLGWFAYNTLTPDMTQSTDNTTDAATINLDVPDIRSNRDR